MFSKIRAHLAAMAAITLTLFASSPSLAGPRDSGGGDICEDRIQLIRDDLREWIHRGGSSELSLPRTLSAQQYSIRMLAQMGAAKIRCVGPYDVGFPIQVNGTPKICRFDQDTESGQITCDAAKFDALGDADQYVLIHHEFAGLAGIEPPIVDDSRYEISNQISDYLVVQTVMKLAVKSAVACINLKLRAVPVGTKCKTSTGSIYERVYRANFGEAWKGPDGLTWSDQVGSGTQYEAVNICKNLGATLPSINDFIRGDGYGFLETLPNMRDRFFWSSSLYSSPSDYSDEPAEAYYFASAGGSTYHYPRNQVDSIRCVVR